MDYQNLNLYQLNHRLDLIFDYQIKRLSEIDRGVLEQSQASWQEDLNRYVRDMDSVNSIDFFKKEIKKRIDALNNLNIGSGFIELDERTFNKYNLIPEKIKAQYVLNSTKNADEANSLVLSYLDLLKGDIVDLHDVLEIESKLGVRLNLIKGIRVNFIKNTVDSVCLTETDQDGKTNLPSTKGLVCQTVTSGYDNTK